MDITSLYKTNSTSIAKAAAETYLQNAGGPKGEFVGGFDSILSTALDNINTTNAYLSDAEDEEIRWSLGETESTHDLTIALQKASVALQYTVAIRDKLLDAYKELMQIQI